MLGLAIGRFLEDIMQLYSSKSGGAFSTHYCDEVRTRWPSCMADLDAFWSPRLGKNSLEALKVSKTIMSQPQYSLAL